MKKYEVNLDLTVVAGSPSDAVEIVERRLTATVYRAVSGRVSGHAALSSCFLQGLHVREHDEEAT